MGGMVPVVFPPPALPGSGYKGMISACISSRTFPGKGTPLMKYRNKGTVEKLKNQQLRLRLRAIPAVGQVEVKVGVTVDAGSIFNNGIRWNPQRSPGK
jgi:hypothetical protein